MHNQIIFNSDHIYPFLHIISAILFISVQLCVILRYKEINKEDFKGICALFRKYQRGFLLFLIFCASTGMIISIGKEKFLDPMVEAVIYTKILLSFVLFIVFIFTYYKMKIFKENISNDIEARENSIIVFRYLLPLNLVLSVILVYLGVVISEF